MPHDHARKLSVSFVALLVAACAASPAEEAPRADTAAAAASSTPANEVPGLTQAAEAAFQRQNWSEAARGFERLTELEPEKPRHWMRLGFCRHSLRDYPAAIAAFERVQQGPAVAHAKYNIACGLALQGKTDAAFEALDRAVAAGFAESSTLAADADLAALRGDARFEKLLEKLRQSPQQPPASAQATVGAPEARQFDFWIGEWQVFSPQGALAGHSRIEKILGGAALLENWTNAQGHEGKSFNRWDAADRLWHQHWIDASGSETFYAGSFADGCMSLTSEQKKPDGTTELHRMRFFDLGTHDLGTREVRQWGEVSSDGGANWKTEFDLTYRLLKGE